MKRSLILATVLVAAGLAAWLLRQFFRPVSLPPKPRTVEQVLHALEPAARSRLEPVFQQAGVSFPPAKIALLAFKEEKRLDLFASGASGDFRHVLSWPILAASGTTGPKLREGDRQVPEGFYRIELLNPNSLFHLSLRVNYPNADDIARAKAEGRDPAGLGGDIMIHGGAASIGCLAIGDEAVEELFVLAGLTGLDRIRLIIAPFDFCASTLPPATKMHGRIADALREFSQSGPKNF